MVAPQTGALVSLLRFCYASVMGYGRKTNMTGTQLPLSDSSDSRDADVTHDSEGLLKDRECPICNQKYRPAKSNQKYCSASCRQRAYRVRKGYYDEAT